MCVLGRSCCRGHARTASGRSCDGAQDARDVRVVLGVSTWMRSARVGGVGARLCSALRSRPQLGGASTSVCPFVLHQLDMSLSGQRLARRSCRRCNLRGQTPSFSPQHESWQRVLADISVSHSLPREGSNTAGCTATKILLFACRLTLIPCFWPQWGLCFLLPALAVALSNRLACKAKYEMCMRSKF
jgi:hypothetical protein